jgi:alcohol dehydrogenase class IV
VFSELAETRVHTLQLPKKMLFGVNAVDRVGSEARAHGRKVLVVTDANIEKVGLLDRVTRSLDVAGIEWDTFDEGGSEPTVEIARDVTEKARTGQYDLVVGVGGGSCLDMAKLASIAVTNTEDIRAYIGVDRVQRPGIPKILISTTAGTASEVTNVSVLTIPDEDLKTVVVSPFNFADAAITDPTMTLTVPQSVTAATGLDALSHAVEAIMSRNANAVTDLLAFKAVRLIGENLRVAYAQLDNLAARYNMALGCLLAGMAFGNAGVCIGHGAAYTFAVRHHVSHGVSCGLALPYVMEFNALACEPKLAVVSEALTGLSYVSIRDAAAYAAIAVKDLMVDVNLPTNLKELGIPRNALPALTEKLLATSRLLSRNPRHMSQEDAVRLFDRMWGGTLGRAP